MYSGSNILSILAKVGHKLDGNKETQAGILYAEYSNPEIITYPMHRLSTIQDILADNHPVQDIVMLEELRKFSLDYDYKRKPLGNGDTAPHTNMKEFLRFRGVANNLRDKRGERATPELVDYYQSRAKQNVRTRGGNTKDCIRHFLRALVQGVAPFKREQTYINIVKLLAPLGVNLSDLKNANRKQFFPQVVFNSSKNRKCIRDMLRALGYKSNDKFQVYLDLLIHPSLSNPVTMYD